jgi:hypothetical protein
MLNHLESKPSNLKGKYEFQIRGISKDKKSINNALTKLKHKFDFIEETSQNQFLQQDTQTSDFTSDLQS